MKFLFILGVFAVLGVAGAWWTAPATSGSPWIVDRPPAEATLERLRRVIEAPEEWLRISAGWRLPQVSVRDALGRLLIAGWVAPVIGLITISAILTGLIVRESARDALRFSSPTLNYLGKRLAAAALVAGFALPILPIAVPPWTLYLAGFLFAKGVGTYVANLPVKL